MHDKSSPTYNVSESTDTEPQLEALVSDSFTAQSAPETYDAKRVHRRLVEGVNILLERELERVRLASRCMKDHDNNLLTMIAKTIAPRADARPVWRYPVNRVFSMCIYEDPSSR